MRHGVSNEGKKFLNEMENFMETPSADNMSMRRLISSTVRVMMGHEGT